MCPEHIAKQSGGALKEEWEKMDLESIMNLYSSMPHRVKALQCAKGSYTKY